MAEPGGLPSMGSPSRTRLKWLSSSSSNRAGSNSIKLNPEHKTKTTQNSTMNPLGLLKTRLFTSFHFFFADLRDCQSSTVFFSTVRVDGCPDACSNLLQLLCSELLPYLLSSYCIAFPFLSLLFPVISLSLVSPSNYSVWNYAIPNKKYFSSVCHCSSRRPILCQQNE